MLIRSHDRGHCAPKLATGNGQLATYFIDASFSSLVISKRKLMVMDIRRHPFNKAVATKVACCRLPIANSEA